jgi:hypothetical protein
MVRRLPLHHGTVWRLLADRVPDPNDGLLSRYKYSYNCSECGTVDVDGSDRNFSKMRGKVEVEGGKIVG